MELASSAIHLYKARWLLSLKIYFVDYSTRLKASWYDLWQVVIAAQVYYWCSLSILLEAVDMKWLSSSAISGRSKWNTSTSNATSSPSLVVDVTPLLSTCAVLRVLVASSTPFWGLS